MNITAKVKRVIQDRLKTGKWTGAYHEGIAVVTIDGKRYPLEDVLKAMDYPLTYKYTEETHHEDMGESLDSRDTEVDGDGDSQSQE